jgi:hypothetical protein
MESASIFFAMGFAWVVGMIAFNVGRWSVTEPKEEEIIRRIVASRIEKRVREQVEEELARELNRRAAT